MNPTRRITHTLARAAVRRPRARLVRGLLVPVLLVPVLLVPVLLAAMIGAQAALLPASAAPTTSATTAAPASPANASGMASSPEMASGQLVSHQLPASALPAAPPARSAGCGLLDAVCEGALAGPKAALGAVKSAAGDDVAGVVEQLPDLGDIANPMEGVGGMIAGAAAGWWTDTMLTIWAAGLFVLRIVLTLSELFLTPDLSAGGPGRGVYGYMLWIGLVLVTILALVQLGAAAIKREGKGLGRALIGSAQFVLICATWFGYCVMLVAACGALTKVLMMGLLKVDSWGEFDPLNGLGAEEVTSATVATVLAVLGAFLWLAAIGHLLIYLARAASLLVLVATGPITAAGLVLESTRSWFWKSLRWFHAAAFTPVLMVMVLGLGVQLGTGVANQLAEDTLKAIGTALPAIVVMLISVVAPLALFKLLAFVDPGTPSGASFRQGLAASGGIQGLLSGNSGGGSSAAAASDSSGRSAGESSAEGSTNDRFSKSTQGALGSLGGVGQVLARGMGMVNGLGAQSASLMSDETNQAGVGQSAYGPDFGNNNRSGAPGQSGPQRGDPSDQNGGQADGQSSGQGPSGSGPENPTATPPLPPPPVGPPMPAAGSPAPPGGQGTGQLAGQGAGQGGGQGGPGAPPGPGPVGGAGGAGGAGAGAGGAAAGGVPPVA